MTETQELLFWQITAIVLASAVLIAYAIDFLLLYRRFKGKK